MKKILTSLTILFFLTQTLSANADSMMYSKQVRAKIMDQFKNDQYKNIYNNNNVFLAEENLNFFETDKKIELLNDLRAKNEEKKSQLTQERDILENRIYNLETTLAELDAQIEENTQKMNSLTIEITTLNTDIEALKVEIVDLQKQIVENRAVLVEYIGHIYKKVEVNSENNEIDTLKTILLNSKDLSEVLSDIHYSSILEVTGQALVERHKKLVKQHFFKKIALQNAMQRSVQAKKEELIQRKMILEKREFRQKILDFTKGKQELFQEYIEWKVNLDQKLKIKILQNKLIQREQRQEVLKKYNCEYVNIDNYGEKKEVFFVEEQNQSMDCIALNKVLDAEGKLTSFAAGKPNPLLWPIDTSKGISAYYKDPEYHDFVGTSHDAIDIRAPQGTDIVAPADGYVTFVREPNDGWYAYVVLKHADGFVTVYGHVNEVHVQQYDFIKAGTVFARSGWEVGTNGAWYMTTGPHLHFEVFKDKEYVDPLDYLDLTVLGENKIPNTQKYIYKYMQDFALKHGVEYEWGLKDKIKIFKLEWQTEEERQKYLLANYATKDFNNWDMWVEEALAAKLDPSFLMCIWLSESGLGRNLKTAYNVGNIGNTDSGGTWDFENPRQWVYWMWKTLNNKFLGWYQEMNKLSRYWNSNGAIYASSPLNWQNNMVRCLTALKQTYIPDNYKFRIE